MEDFADKVAVITGTANPRGIGMAIARRLAAEGAKLVLADVNGDGAAERAADLRADGTDAMAVTTDMGDHASVVALAETTYERHGAAHVLVLNHVAPTGGPGHGLLNPDPGSWVLHTNVNLLGVVYGIKAFVPRMIEAGEHAHVMATTSGAGSTGTMYGNGPYCVTKAAIVKTMECLRGQLRDAEADIVASLIFPGLTNTGPNDEATHFTVDMLRQFGLPATFTDSSEVADDTLRALRADSFWARTPAGDERHRETVEWEHEVWAKHAQIWTDGGDPSDYAWGPPSDLLERIGDR